MKHLLVGLLAITGCVMVIACNNKQDMSTRTKISMGCQCHSAP
ncbi:hypothetical protein HMPREF0971_02899 [Segatella oris F0302]|uniref:Lipoprotein n=1 Tax=Segatella oris F0302 TaxID=649760 RepID=D1QV62_9BACT|nr:hypothetical protein HMPREF0971_02899 [Segatella oris F0302]